MIFALLILCLAVYIAMKAPARSLVLFVAVMGFASQGSAEPLPALHAPLYNAINLMPEGSWAQVNANTFKSVWTPASQRPLLNTSGTNPTPHKIVSAWSGYGWDTRRGDLIIYGGGHANYSGNDVYRWRSSTLRWERVALPSEIVRIPSNAAGWLSVDGPDNSPNSAHTYDNNLYLPIVDRFLSFGGAIFNTGGTYLRENENSPGTYRATGPYLLDPSRADGEKVGGQTGSHVQRVSTYPDVVGAGLWENRDIHKHLAGSPLPKSHVNGCTAYAEENDRDVVYISGGNSRDLYRYEVGDIDTPRSDRIAKVGHWYYGPTGQMTCALDASNGIFLKTGPATKPLTFWDIAKSSSTNRDKVVELNDSINAFIGWLAANSFNITRCALDHDPARSQFLMWCGGGTVWSIRPPGDKGAAGWVMEQLSPAGVASPATAVETGVLGKWKYIPGYDVFIALQDSTLGNIWVYKPLGWQPDSQNLSPSVEILGPSAGASLPPGVPVMIAAQAGDSDGHIERVQFYLDDLMIGEALSEPYSISWIPMGLGAYSLTARAFDNMGAMSVTSATHVLLTGAPNANPIITFLTPGNDSFHPPDSLVQLTADATDTDGTVARVEYFVDGVKVGEVYSAPWLLYWSPPSIGTYEITAVAIDDRGGAGIPAAITIAVGEEGTTGATITLQEDTDSYIGTTDTYITDYKPSANYGNSPALCQLGKRYTALIRFAVFESEGGPVPDGATILSAELLMHKNDYDFVYRVHPMLLAWRELKANWYQADVGTNWAVPGANGAGSDYAHLWDDEFASKASSTEVRFDVTSRLQSWSDGQANHGWRIVGVSGTNRLRIFRSSEYGADMSKRPSLKIRYIAGPGN